MATEDRRREILGKLSDSVVKYDEELVVRYATTAVSEGLDASDAIMNGFAV